MIPGGLSTKPASGIALAERHSPQTQFPDSRGADYGSVLLGNGDAATRRRPPSLRAAGPTRAPWVT